MTPTPDDDIEIDGPMLPRTPLSTQTVNVTFVAKGVPLTPTPKPLPTLGDEAASRKLSPIEVHAAADAWEAERASWWRAVGEYRAAMSKALEDERSLRQRLEAADEHIGVLAARLAVLSTRLEAARKKARDWEEICRHLKAEK